MKRRDFLRTTGVAAALEPFAVAEATAATERDRERCRSFVRSLPTPEHLCGESGYAFAYTTKRGPDEPLPDAAAYGTVFTPETAVTVALGVRGSKPTAADLVERGRDPAARRAGRPIFLGRGRTRYRAVAPGEQTTLVGIGSARPALLDAVAALADARQNDAGRYYEHSRDLRTLADHLGTGAYLSADVRPQARASEVVATGDRVAVRDGTASVRSVALFESATAARSTAVATAADVAPLPDVPTDTPAATRRVGRAVVREATVGPDDLDRDRSVADDSAGRRDVDG